MTEAADEKFEIEIADDNVAKPDTNAGGADADAGKQAEPEVDVVDDTPEADKGRPRRPDGVEPDIPDDDEISKYTEGVQKRIKKLRYEYHEERRAKEERERQLQEAVRVAQTSFKAAEELRQKVYKAEQLLKEQADARIKAELDKAKDAYKKAFEAGDAEQAASAQEHIARLASEHRDLELYTPRAPQPGQQPPVMPAPTPDRKSQEWAQRNTWFMQDRHMTNYALALDERLKAEGVDPSSDDYFRRIDEGMRREFPNRFSDARESVTPQSRQGPPVAPGNRSPVNPPRKITLTKSQVELARRLGISPEGYAKQLMNLQKEGKL